MIHALASLRILPALAPLSPQKTGGISTGGAPGDSANFSDTLRNAIADVDQAQVQAESTVRGVLQGTGTDVHKAVIAVEKADLSFQLMLQVRNKIVAAYQEVERLQF